MLDIEKIKKLLESKNMTQAQLGDSVGVTESMISYVLRGFKKPSLEVTKRIADTLGVKIDDIVKEAK